ncbi:CbtA family protein [Rhizobium rhizogenes]|uniref:CbtA family protein n=1 Tax=Rhizobium rhizogenes TaxID=359 RepID=UPI001574EBE1|nr:CbtA family protein [Rhizobium rhizogenes]MDJ1633611.1 CbtA family protein [Rhizobium rhizogenes]NTG71961.1 CbtA family protein [Rhizobium rhizogenes]NTI20600.1 CbtA family protein [Rhizobium rhizogenes]NTI27061.1 CbtA family protein [Rhizobium rhizogenes]NTI60009.1 CbtA family protein [Rhizobium rhizogenes]
MVGRLLLRGMLVGALAGILIFIYARIFGEPLVDWAIGFEEKAAQAAGEASEPEIVSRATQAGVGLLTGSLIYATAVGGLFALVFAFVYGRISSLGARGTAALLAIAAFVAISLVPDLKYPANPPAVGNPDTIGVRTELFFVMIVASIVGMIVAVGFGRWLVARYGSWNGVILAGIGYFVFIALIQYLLPPINEVPEQFSAIVLWQFRITSLGMHAILWATLGLAFGAWAERDLPQVRYGRTALRRA